MRVVETSVSLVFFPIVQENVHFVLFLVLPLQLFAPFGRDNSDVCGTGALTPNAK